MSEKQVANLIADLAIGMVLRPASPDDAADPQAWLRLLRDDLDQLERSLPASARLGRTRS